MAGVYVMLQWIIHEDGCWVAIGQDGQRYEVGEYGGGEMILNICGVRRFGGATTNECKAHADEHEYRERVLNKMVELSQ
jgi:hypothetical protein